MLYGNRRSGRLFLLLLCVLAEIVTAQTPSTTTVVDTVYRADDTPAGGTLLISWPAFTTAGGQAVAAGTKRVILGPAGALSVALVPTSAARPANTVYTIVYQLHDAVTNRQIVDEEKFKQGLSKLIDGTVDCLNASVWRKTAQ